MSDDFDRWMRRKAPEIQVDENARRLLRSRVEDRLHHRRQAHRTVLRVGLAAMVVGGFLFGMDVDPLGSYNRDLIPAKHRDDVLVSPIPDGFAGYLVQENAPREFWEHFKEQRTAGLREFAELGFSEFNGKIMWSIAYKYWIDGEQQVIAEQLQDGVVNTMDRETMRLVLRYTPILHDRIRNGAAEELPSRLVYVDGQARWLQVWRLETPEGVFTWGLTPGKFR